MYSRNRPSGGEDRYRSNLPPHYSGNLFRSAGHGEEIGIRATDERQNRPPVRESPPDPPPAEPSPAAEEQEAPATPSSDVPAEESGHGRLPGGIGELIDLLGQEELLLIALLLLLSAEHDRAMDIIVVLLLLLGIQ